MSGKAQLILVIGFGALFLIFGTNFATVSTRSVDNSMLYYDHAIAKNIARAGAQLAVRQIGLDASWMDADELPSTLLGGTLSVTVDTHAIGGGLQRKIVTATGTFANGQVSLSDTVRVLLETSYLSDHAYKHTYDEPSSYWSTGDTVWGPARLNNLSTDIFGDPVFAGFVSRSWPGDLSDTSLHPRFLGGLDPNGDWEYPNSSPVDSAYYRGLAQTNGRAIADTAPGMYRHTETWLTFADDNGGSVTDLTRLAGIGTLVDSINQPLRTYAPNGVIYVDNGDIHLKGTVKGSLTILVNSKDPYRSAATANTPAGPGPYFFGNIYIDDNLRYATDPLNDPTSMDKLGLVTWRNVLLSVAPTTLTVDAYILCLYDDFGLKYAYDNFTATSQSQVDSYASVIQGHLFTLIGGYTSFATNGWYSGAVSKANPWHKQIHYDKRWRQDPSPYFPRSDRYRVVAWME